MLTTLKLLFTCGGIPWSDQFDFQQVIGSQLPDRFAMPQKVPSSLLVSITLFVVGAVVAIFVFQGTGDPGEPAGDTQVPGVDSPAAQEKTDRTLHVEQEPGETVVEEPGDDGISEDVFTKATDWLAENETVAEPSPELLESGRQILTERREALKGLLAEDPERALQLAFTDEEHKQVPDELRGLLEEPVRTTGTLLLGIACSGYHEPGVHSESEMWREAHFGKSHYQAHTFGLREELQSLENVPLNGIAVDGAVALEGEPLVPIREGDAGFELGRIRARFGQNILEFSNRTAFEQARRQANEAERNSDGPYVSYPDFAVRTMTHTTR